MYHYIEYHVYLAGTTRSDRRTGFMRNALLSCLSSWKCLQDRSWNFGKNVNINNRIIYHPWQQSSFVYFPLLDRLSTVASQQVGRYSDLGGRQTAHLGSKGIAFITPGSGLDPPTFGLPQLMTTTHSGQVAQAEILYVAVPQKTWTPPYRVM